MDQIRQKSLLDELHGDEELLTVKATLRLFLENGPWQMMIRGHVHRLGATGLAATFDTVHLDGQSRSPKNNPVDGANFVDAVHSYPMQLSFEDRTLPEPTLIGRLAGKRPGTGNALVAFRFEESTAELQEVLSYLRGGGSL